MEVNIILKDSSDDKRVEFSRSNEKGKIFVTVYHGQQEVMAEVNLDEVRHALRTLAVR